MKGIDYSAGRPGGNAIKNKGYDFVCRYLSHSSWKNLSKDEVKDLHDHDLKIVLVWETYALRPAAGFNAGVLDAKFAKEMALLLGWTEDKCIYFACDSDLIEYQQINSYFKGILSTMPVDQVGVYGSYLVVKKLLDDSLVKFVWQTSAWSGSKWDSRANIRQVKYNVKINKVLCDENISMTNDFGQF